MEKAIFYKKIKEYNSLKPSKKYFTQEELQHVFSELNIHERKT